VSPALGCLGQRQIVDYFVVGGWGLCSRQERDLLTGQITLTSVTYYRLLLRNNWSAVRRPLRSKKDRHVWRPRPFLN
jgi:hypothetical protein